jgi:hypothetical protein
VLPERGVPISARRTPVDFEVVRILLWYHVRPCRRNTDRSAFFSVPATAQKGL